MCGAHTATQTFGKKTCGDLKGRDCLIKSDSPVRSHRSATVSLGICMFPVKQVGLCPPLRSPINMAAGLLQDVCDGAHHFSVYEQLNCIRKPYIFISLPNDWGGGGAVWIQRAHVVLNWQSYYLSSEAKCPVHFPFLSPC